MNGLRRVVLAAGLLLITAMGAFPPWVTGPVAHPSATTPAGYHFILAPPSTAPPGPLVWSDKHQWFERDGKPASTEAALDDWKKWSKYDSPVPDPYRPWEVKYRGALTRSTFVRIDYSLLLVQWVVVAALAGVAMLLRAPGNVKVRT